MFRYQNPHLAPTPALVPKYGGQVLNSGFGASPSHKIHANKFQKPNSNSFLGGRLIGLEQVVDTDF